MECGVAKGSIDELEQLYAPKVVVSPRQENPPPIEKMVAFSPDANARPGNLMAAYHAYSEKVIKANRPNDKKIIARMKMRP
jgi:hypothetical protein